MIDVTIDAAEALTFRERDHVVLAFKDDGDSSVHVHMSGRDALRLSAELAREARIASGIGVTLSVGDPRAA